jgi:hypothetical protein
MFCPKCGFKIAVDDAKFCHNCGFDFSKIDESKPTELKKMIDLTLKDQVPETPSQADKLHTKVEKGIEKRIKIRWLKNLSAVQKTILIIGGLFAISMDLALAINHQELLAALGFIIIFLMTLFITYKAPTWGWGWYILLGIFWTNTKFLEKYGNHGNVVQLLGLALVLIIYFLFRNKVLKQTGKQWTRSLISGIGAYVVGFILIYLIIFFALSSDS